MATFSSMSTAEARVVLSSAKYFRLARKVIWPGPACSMPATPEISRSRGPSRRQLSLWASSESFMDAPQASKGNFKSLRFKGFREKGKDKDNAEAWGPQRRQRIRSRSLLVEKEGLSRRSCGGGFAAGKGGHNAKRKLCARGAR